MLVLIPLSVFFDKNISKSQKVLQFYFLGKVNLIVHPVKIAKKYINRGGISKSSKAVSAPRLAAEKSNPTIFVTLPHQFGDDSATIH